MNSGKSKNIVNHRTRTFISFAPDLYQVWFWLLVVFSSFFGSLLTALISPEAAKAQDSNNLLDKALQAYQDGNYSDAATHYQNAILLEHENGYVYYNLGNSFFREGKIGLAIAAYREALRLAPRYSPLQTNLGLARSKTTDNLESRHSFFFQLANKLLFLHSYLSQKEVFSLSLLLLAIAWVFIGVRFLFPEWKRKLPISILFLASVFLGTSSLLSRIDRSGAVIWALSREERSLTPAVVITKELQVRSGDGPDYQVVFILHEGAEVETGEIRGAWLQVFLPDGRSGWSDAASLKKIGEWTQNY